MFMGLSMGVNRPDMFLPDATPIQGAPFNYLNQPIPGAAAGTIYHNSPELFITISSLDGNGINHYNLLAAMTTGDSITVATQTGTLTGPSEYMGGGMWKLPVDAWPAIIDGNYLVTVTGPF
jgi:hypothetical protein